MKKVLCMPPTLNVGGAETFLMKIYRSLNREEYQLDFCVGGEEKGFYEDEIAALGGRVWHIPLKSKGIVPFTKAFWKLLRTKKYDAILRFGDTWISGYELWIARLCGVKVRAMRSCNANAQLGKLGMVLHKCLRSIAMSAANVKIAPSTEAARFTFGDRCVDKGKVHLLHNAIQYENYAYCEESRAQIRQEFDLAGCPVFLHVGRMSKQKNHAFLIEVFAKIKEKLPKAKLILVGDGELRNDIEAQIADKALTEDVILTGVRSDAAKFLSAADLFLFPSLYEGMPNTVIEAQAAGLPCILSDSVTKEADITGLLEYLPRTDPQQWAEQSLQLLAKFDKRVDTREAFVLAQYDIESVCARFTELLF